MSRFGYRSMVHAVAVTICHKNDSDLRSSNVPHGDHAAGGPAGSSGAVCGQLIELHGNGDLPQDRLFVTLAALVANYVRQRSSGRCAVPVPD